MQKLLQLLYKLDAALARLEQTYRERNMEESDAPIVQPPAPVTPFEKFCVAIIQFEGANPANNNPFDFRYFFGGYLPKYGIVHESPAGFAMFETYALGYEYGQVCIKEMVVNHPDWDFLDFFMRFAPPSDNNPTVHYARTIAAAMQVVITANLKTTLQL